MKKVKNARIRIFPDSYFPIQGNLEKTHILAYFMQCRRKWVTAGSEAEPFVILFAMLKGKNLE